MASGLQGFWSGDERWGVREKTSSMCVGENVKILGINKCTRDLPTVLRWAPDTGFYTVSGATLGRKRFIHLRCVL